MAKKKKKKKYKVKVGRIIFLLLFIVIIGFVARIALDAKGMYDNAKTAKHQLEAMLTDIKAEEYVSAQEKAAEVHDILKQIRAKVEGPIWEHCDKLPKYGGDYVAGCRLLDIADEMLDKYMGEGFALLDKHPLSSIKEDDKFNVKALLDYLAFAEEALPDVEAIVAEVSKMEISFDTNGLLHKYSGKVQELIDVYHDAEVYIPLLKAILQNGENRLYLVVAQNSAEIRASGGYPGSIGTMRIKDGYLSIGDFNSVWNVLIWDYDPDKYSFQEFYMFYGWLQYPRDACYDPYYPRAAEIWADSYEQCMHEYVDGVISLTPAIIQDILGCTGPITVSDGTVLDGNYCTKYIQSDIYLKYLNAEEVYTDIAAGNDASDAIFGEVAQLAMKQVFSNLNPDTLTKFIDIVHKRIDDRIIMVWMKDPDAEEIIRSCGASGEFNRDPQNPQLGVFFSNCNPSKLGWYLDMDIKVGDPVELWDGSLQYPVTVSLFNTIDWDTVYYAGDYIAGNWELGPLISYIHLAAPAGGYISDYWMDIWFPMEEDVYMGNQVVFARNFYMYPQEGANVYFNVTTAPGVKTPLSVVHTPTLQEYR
ncbi:MAG: DUF4012 domain-containing protein [Firmicutes bacterium]|nr:DUF4012 domain-containing protein [Bacillota bacterium]